jgi:hypothetical protein
MKSVQTGKQIQTEAEYQALMKKLDTLYNLDPAFPYKVITPDYAALGLGDEPGLGSVDTPATGD